MEITPLQKFFPEEIAAAFKECYGISSMEALASLSQEPDNLMGVGQELAFYVKLGLGGMIDWTIQRALAEFCSK